MVIDEALMYPSYEIIGGEKIMAPAAPVGHSSIIFELAFIIKEYLKKNNNGLVFVDDVDVHLPDGNLFKPDLVVITRENFGIIEWRGAIHGVPDMVVEVLSKSTRKKDLTVKKDSYEKNGVKEYWIVDPYMEIIDVYLLRDGKYYLDGEYANYNDDELEMLNDEQKAEAKFEITLATFPDLTINIKEAFDLDGTITKFETLPLLAKELNLSDEMKILTDLTLSGQISFEQSFRLRYFILKNIPPKKIFEIMDAVELDEDILNFIRENKKFCAVVTGNLDIWIEPLTKKLGCEIFSSQSECGELKKILNKAEVICELKKTAEEIISIGDGFFPLLTAEFTSRARKLSPPPIIFFATGKIWCSF